MGDVYVCLYVANRNKFQKKNKKKKKRETKKMSLSLFFSPSKDLNFVDNQSSFGVIILYNFLWHAQ